MAAAGEAMVMVSAVVEPSDALSYDVVVGAAPAFT